MLARKLLHTGLPTARWLAGIFAAKLMFTFDFGAMDCAAVAAGVAVFLGYFTWEYEHDV